MSQAADTLDDGAGRQVRDRCNRDGGTTELGGQAHAHVAELADVDGLDRAPSDPVDVLIDGRPYALARLVLIDGEYAVQIISLNRPRLAAA